MLRVLNAGIAAVLDALVPQGAVPVKVAQQGKSLLDSATTGG